MSSVPATFNLADIWEAMAERVPDRIAVVCGDVRRTYAELDDRATRLAHWMIDQGVRPGQHVGLYLTNGPEYFEAMLGCYKIRAVPINVNYRYVADELRHLFADADLVGVLVQPEFAERLAEIAADLPELQWSLELGAALRGGAGGVVGRPRLRAPSQRRPLRHLHRRHDRSAQGRGVDPRGRLLRLHRWRRPDAPERRRDRTGRARRPHHGRARSSSCPSRRSCTRPGQWTSLSWLFAGGTVVLLPGSLDPVRVWRTVGEREGQPAHRGGRSGRAPARRRVDGRRARSTCRACSPSVRAARRCRRRSASGSWASCPA